MRKNFGLAAAEPHLVNRRMGIPQRSVDGMFWRVTTAVLVAMAGACSSDSDDGASGTGGATSTPDGSASGTAGMNSAGGGAGASGVSGTSGAFGSSGSTNQGGNTTGVGGSPSGGSSGASGGGVTSGGGTGNGGAIISGGRTGAGGASGGPAGGGGGSAGACIAVGAPCNPDTEICCSGALCVTSTSPDYAGCREPCVTASDCASNCCIPFANLPDKGFCGAASLCQCAGQDETCGGARQCCSGFSCSTFDASGALACHQTCAQNSDCSTNCCVKINGTPDSVCLPAKPWCGQ